MTHREKIESDLGKILPAGGAERVDGVPVRRIGKGWKVLQKSGQWSALKSIKETSAYLSRRK